MLAYKPFQIKPAVNFLRVNKITVWIHYNLRQLSQIVWEWLISRFIFLFPKCQRIWATRIHRRAKYSCYKEGPLKWHLILKINLLFAQIGFSGRNCVNYSPSLKKLYRLFSNHVSKQWGKIYHKYRVGFKEKIFEKYLVSKTVLLLIANLWFYRSVFPFSLFSYFLQFICKTMDNDSLGFKIRRK